MNFGRFNREYLADSKLLSETKNSYFNLTEAALVQQSIQRSEGCLGVGGSLIVTTGSHTGRSPKDKYVVSDKSIEDEIWWEKNGRMEPKNFDLLYQDIALHMRNYDYFVQDLYACANKKYRLNVRLINEFAWHGLFIRHLLRRPKFDELFDFVPEFTIINCPSFKASPERYNVRSETVIAINFQKQLIIVCGTEYAGENKKGIFTILNYLMPKRGVMPMHCSANHSLNDDKEVAIFFGLSGTGKTSLSQDSERILLGDDEHGWSDDGIFNFEGGCYAKTLNLSPTSEPEIYATTTKFSTVIENMNYDKETLQLRYDDDSLSPNMRSAYPLDFIENASVTGIGGVPKNVIFLTCDAFGILPPVAKLSIEQAIYHFLLGFTSKVPGTERGVIEPISTFSPCFAAPFLPLKPELYGELLKNRIVDCNAHCWLVNTGWTGGPYGVGRRMPIEYTRKILKEVLKGSLVDVQYRLDENFGFKVPCSIDSLDTTLLSPKETWSDPTLYTSQAKKLIKMFSANFSQYLGKVDRKIESVAL